MILSTTAMKGPFVITGLEISAVHVKTASLEMELIAKMWMNAILVHTTATLMLPVVILMAVSTVRVTWDILEMELTVQSHQSLQ